MLETQEVNTFEDLQSNLSKMPEFDHEQVEFCHDEETGLKAIIAVHSTVLGPALGGTRMWSYKSEEEAVRDVLRLSRGMTYKASISGLELGGGKAVIIGNSKKIKSEALMKSYGRFVDNLKGKYITAEDVGTSEQDMIYISSETKHVTDIPESMGGSGDPSPVTAYGTYMGMKASVKEMWGNDDLNGKTIAVQGVGHVGQYLVEYLSKENARILVCDINEDNLKSVTDNFKNVSVVSPEEIYNVKMDIYSPCALGATINTETLNQLTCSIIAGAANNQLEDENIHGKMVIEKGILYAPDFLIN
ncbi:MAG: Glu/Leu/Phe/Val dehydrogenase, partial [Bacteroidia bacterium]|nr:Glu/Leu/Phe/Val dehydrogenase [Bacteroidia bacterium]